MKRQLKTSLNSLFLLACVILLTGVYVYGEEYEILKGMDSARAIFDMRSGDPKSAAVLLGMIQQTFQDENLRTAAEKPEFVVVFIGPSVKLISTNTEGFSSDDKEKIRVIANTISEMSKAGIRLEICLAAAHLFGVDPATVLPEIKQVRNGWVTLIGHQAKGYALVPVY
ncbi:MAG: DsrE family protein [Gemmatimonadota bacterium]|nr:MAG: DsrE family protein [Gemmatimonadota bacterium]